MNNLEMLLHCLRLLSICVFFFPSKHYEHFEGGIEQDIIVRVTLREMSSFSHPKDRHAIQHYV